ncbi:MAG: hypothetical protein HUK20_07180, partial [Fibrobacter sp.]|nr:hypothetical protein [Fibrobacter sp.]
MIPQQKKSLLDEGSNCILLHRGGEASVYLFCLNNGEWLVLKWFRQHFDTELVGNACKIKDCGICKIREFGIRDETPYQLYEFVEGISSDSISAMPVTVAICALRQLVASLRKARTAGVSHGDLNPSNVIFSLKETKDAPDFQTVLVDWGIVGPGALSFAAPERFQGRCADEKSDMFSLGLLLFRWLTGENLVQGRDFDSFASRIAALTTDSVTEKLFYSGKFSPEEISALEPIWNSTLRIASEDRAEDFDELDELLEIALDKVGGGEVRQSCVRRKFLEPYLIQVQKMGRKFSSELENPECTQ